MGSPIFPAGDRLYIPLQCTEPCRALSICYILPSTSNIQCYLAELGSITLKPRSVSFMAIIIYKLDVQRLQDVTLDSVGVLSIVVEQAKNHQDGLYS